MQIRNPYKRLDVFRCDQEAHARFSGKVSVYHVLKEKKCYPDGCIYFVWHCIKREKGESCIHKYKYIGRNCMGCTYYHEDKVHLQPQCLLADDDIALLKEQTESYDQWIRGIQYKKISVAGKIHTVKPWFEKNISPHYRRLNFRGYLLVMKAAFIGLDHFLDTIYIRIGEGHLKNFSFVSGMKLECKGEIRADRGRLIVLHPGQFEITGTKTRKSYWTRDKAVTLMKTASFHQDQPEQCLQCPWGVLTDVTDTSRDQPAFYRHLYCLKSVESSEACYIYAMYMEKMRKKRARMNRRL